MEEERPSFTAIGTAMDRSANPAEGRREPLRVLALDRFRLLQPHFEQNRPLRPVAHEAAPVGPMPVEHPYTGPAKEQERLAR
jgi:hypothetical protein